MPASKQLIQAVMVTAELCGRVFSPAAASVFVADIEGFDERQVMGALKRCRKEVKGLISVHDVVSRLDDGRPGVEEAWAAMPRDEATTVVWTEEMAAAWAIALPLLREGDQVGARMAFKEQYGAAVLRARDNKVPPRWTVSLGHDAAGREGALLQAVKKSLISAEHATKMLPHHEVSQQFAALLQSAGTEAKKLLKQ